MLPPATERVWTYLKEQSALAGFILVGGSALALRIQHRLSEDLDFAFPALALPAKRLNALVETARHAGFDFQRNDNEAAVAEFSQGGLELHDYQQDFLVDNAVKVSFFVPDSAQQKIFTMHGDDPVRIASLEEIFKSKALVSSLRSKTRDWFDLYLLMLDHGFTIRDYKAAFIQAGIPSSCDIGLARLCSGVPQKNDEGYAHLLSAPPKLEEIKAFFIEQRNRLEIEIASDLARSNQQKIK